jgi:hypothetical protein
MQANRSGTFESNRKWVVVSILLISLLLRWVLIIRGGQYFNSDETRYLISLNAARLLWQGQFGEALRQFTISPEHIGFKVIGLIPALTEHFVGPSLVIPAMFFSLFSVLNLYLIYLLARRNQVSSRESLYALFLAASCMSLLYYSRHLVPYDLAMSFGLMALYVALARTHPARVSLACGILSFLCFITYNGYWLFAGFASMANVLIHPEGTRKLILKAVMTTIGFATPLVVLILVMLRSGTDMIAAYRLFSASITQGSFQEGWSLPFEYFWHTENAIFLFLVIFSTFAIRSQFRNLGLDTKVWLGGLIFIYVCLLIPSTFLHYFVVYARLARQLTPFLVLLAAQGLVQLEAQIPSRLRISRLLLTMIFIQATWNYANAYQLSYPREFAAEAQIRFPEFEFSSKRLAYGAPVVCQHNGYAIENAKFYVAPPERIPRVQGQLLLSAPHPTNYQPYLYEGDPPEFRQIYRALKLRMNFYKLDEQFMTESNPAWKSLKSCITNEN